MAILRVHHGSAVREVVLAPSSLVGRHWGCVGVLPVASVPLYWLEIRWLGERWAWRELTPRGQTRGTGEALPEGWRSLSRGATVRWSEDVRVEFVDDEAPGPACVALIGSEYVTGARLSDLLELSPEGARPLGEDTFPARWLEDGDVFLAALPGERVVAWRWLKGEAPVVTARDGFALTHGEVSLDIDLRGLTATFTLRRMSATVRGEGARMLAVYATARRDEDWVDGGYLAAREAVARWEALGGISGGPPERAAWERGRIRTQLASQGIRGGGELFERGRHQGEPTFRLALEPRRIHLGDDG